MVAAGVFGTGKHEANLTQEHIVIALRVRTIYTTRRFLVCHVLILLE
jgi:hypothetical protein